MQGINEMNQSMGEMMLEYNKYEAKCVKEGRKPLGFMRFMIESFKGTLEY